MAPAPVPVLVLVPVLVPVLEGHQLADLAAQAPSLIMASAVDLDTLDLPPAPLGTPAKPQTSTTLSACRNRITSM